MVRRNIEAFVKRARAGGQYENSKILRQAPEVVRFFELCRGYDTMAVKVALVKNLEFTQARDGMGISPLHMACMNTHDEGPEMVEMLLNLDSLAARCKDNLGQLPLHVACRNSGPFTCRGFPMEAEQIRQKSSSIYRMVLSLLRAYPQAASEPDMDGLLPLDWVLNHPNIAGCQEAVSLLLAVYPDAVHPEPILSGSASLPSRWHDLARILSNSDHELARESTLTLISQPLTCRCPDGISAGAPRVFLSLENSCPVFQSLRIAFEALRTRLHDIYGGRHVTRSAAKAQNRELLARSLKGTEVDEDNSFSHAEAETTVVLARYWMSKKKKKKLAKAKSDADAASSTTLKRRERWRQFGLRHPQFFIKMLDLPKAHVTGLGSFLASNVNSWLTRMMQIRPTDIWSSLERLPIHTAASRHSQDSLNVLKQVLNCGPHGVRARDHLGRLPLHIASQNEDPAAEDIVEELLALYPLAVHAQDHSGMLPLHYAAMNSGPCASGMAGRLISAFACGAQAVDDSGRLPIDYSLMSSSLNVTELIKSVSRAFVPGCRIQGVDGDNILHRICRRICVDESPAALDILRALLEVRIRPNLCSLHNCRKELPMHIIATCTKRRGADAVNLLAEAYLPACWAQVAHLS
jgi:ankyrin repeat protein